MVALYAGRSGRGDRADGTEFQTGGDYPAGEVSGVPDVAGQGAYRYDDGAFRELRRYDLGGRVAYLEGETTRRVIDLRGQLTGLGEVSGEQLAERNSVTRPCRKRLPG